MKSQSFFAVIGLCAGISAVSQTLPPSSTDAGCLARGATGYWVVEDDQGMREYLFVLDAEDSNGDPSPDGLPEKVWCSESVDGILLTASSTSSCTNLTTLTTLSDQSCKFAIDVWVGSSAADGSTAAPIDCSSNPHPILMFGGDGVDILIGTAIFGDSLHGGDLGPGETRSTTLDEQTGSDYRIQSGHLFDGRNQETGQKKGDALSGLGGNDYLCGGHRRDVIRGGNGDDVVWGGTGEDLLSGGGGQDVVQGAGGDDKVSGGSENDYVFGGGGSDKVTGDGGNDRVHGGKGRDRLNGGDGNDEVFAMDGEKDAKVNGGSDIDKCWHDSADNPSACESDPVLMRESTLMYPLVVASHETVNNLAWLYELELNGVLHDCQSGTILDPVGSEYAEEVIGLAIDPIHPETLAALVRFPVSGLLFVTVDLPRQPANFTSCAGEYQTELVGEFRSSALTEPVLVDIAFDGQGRLSALTENANWIALQVSSSVVSEVRSEPVGRTNDWNGHTPKAFSMAYDSPDGGFFLILTDDPNPNDLPGGPFSCFDAFVPMDTGSRSMPTEDHIAASQLGQAPFTVTQRTNAGSLLTLENVGSADAPIYEMVEIQRQNWNRGPWEGLPPCPVGGACIAQIDHEFVAITMPHFSKSNVELLGDKQE